MTLAAVQDAAHRIEGFRKVGQFRTSRAALYALTSETSATHHLRIAEVMGMVGWTVVLDPYLPPGAWQLCDTDNTMLYDNRQGMTLAEILGESCGPH